MVRFDSVVNFCNHSPSRVLSEKSSHLRYLLKLAENMKLITGLAAELSGARLWMKVAMALTVSLLGMSS